MKVLYFDCFSGISGDMTLGALLDLGVSAELLIAQLKTLRVDGWEMIVNRTVKNGISANHVEVKLTHDEHEHHHEHEHEHHHSHEHRTYQDIVKIIDESEISDRAKALAQNIFHRLAVAEAKVHASTPEEVHFHEVGAVDSIIDIVGAAVCIDLLAPDRVFASTVHDGHGFTVCQHGQIPVPVPAAVEVFGGSGIETKQLDIDKELVTPTGAAIIAELAGRSSLMPNMRVVSTGYGAGTRDLEIPNVLRVVLGETAEEKAADSEITVLETNIDDTTPEMMGYVMERLFTAGAKDVYFTNIQMKKNRPAYMLTVLCAEADKKALAEIIFAETSTIGIRERTEHRICLPRRVESVDTPFGKLDVKISSFNGTERVMPEYERAKALAEKNNVPLHEIYEAVTFYKTQSK